MLESNLDTLHYFFSTLTQSFAALVAFVYVAAQGQIAWLDTKITNSKKALLYQMHGSSREIEFHLARYSATEAAKHASEQRGAPEILRLMANDLTDYIKKIQKIRKEIKTLVVFCTTLVISSLLVIPLVPTIEKNNLGNSAMIIFSLAAIFGGWKSGSFIYKSLTVTLREKI